MLTRGEQSDDQDAPGVALLVRSETALFGSASLEFKFDFEADTLPRGALLMTEVHRHDHMHARS